MLIGYFKSLKRYLSFVDEGDTLVTDNNDLSRFQRLDGVLTVLDEVSNWISPRLGIRFVMTQDNLEVYYPDGRLFLTTVELNQKVDQERQRADRLAAQLRVLGGEPE